MWKEKWSFSKSTEKINSDVLLPSIHIYLQTPRLHRQKNSKTQGGGAGEGARLSQMISSHCVLNVRQKNINSALHSGPVFSSVAALWRNISAGTEW